MINELFDLSHMLAEKMLRDLTYPWEALDLIGSFIIEEAKKLPPSKYEMIGENIWVAKSAKIAETALLQAPCIIGEDTELRQGAFIRGNVLVGNGCVIGNSTELKNVIIFDRVQAPHFNYIGDSIVGYGAHMGAGVIVSNVRGDKKNVSVKYKENEYKTERKKVGAFIGDGAEIGCNSVINPGSVLGRHCQIYPLSSFCGHIDENCKNKINGGK